MSAAHADFERRGSGRKWLTRMDRQANVREDLVALACVDVDKVGCVGVDLALGDDGRPPFVVRGRDLLPERQRERTCQSVRKGEGEVNSDLR